MTGWNKHTYRAFIITLLFGIALGVSLDNGGEITLSLLKGGMISPQKAGSAEKMAHPLRMETEIPKEALGKLNLFVLAGQSNMSGYADIDPNHNELEPKAFVFGNNYRWRVAQEPIDDPTGQVDPVSLDIGAGYSCGTSFARTFIKHHPNEFVGLIPCAKNGSSIEEWQRSLSDNSLYGSCLKRALAASPMGKIRGLLFFQGETDAMAPDLDVQRVKFPFRWGEKFSRFVNDFRNDLKIRDLPVVFAQIGINKEPKAFKNWKIVQEEQRKVRLARCRMIKTDDLSLKDEVHFDNKSYQVIGERFAFAISEILSGR